MHGLDLFQQWSSFDSFFYVCCEAEFEIFFHASMSYYLPDIQKIFWTLGFSETNYGRGRSLHYCLCMARQWTWLHVSPMEQLWAMESTIQVNLKTHMGKNDLKKKLPCSSVAHVIYKFLPFLDNHNKDQQNALTLEKTWPTKSSWISLVTSLIGIAAVDKHQYTRATNTIWKRTKVCMMKIKEWTQSMCKKWQIWL